MKNQRNYYRILHVQPEAPIEVIKASYRSMMTKMRLHPDLGGDHETAVLINQAYTVLSDSLRREQYDRLLRERFPYVIASMRREAGAAIRDSFSTSAQRGKRSYGASPPARAHCVFCKTPISGPVRADSRCSRCNSPLVHGRRPEAAPGRELFGRRAVPRQLKDEPITFCTHWPHQGTAARLLDLSPVGVRFVTGVAVELDRLVKINGTSMDGVARVVALRSMGKLYSIHADLITVMFPARSGVFVAERV